MTGFITLVLLFLIGIWIYVELASLPGKKARERGHPQADAINVLAWIGLLLGAIPWVIALVWAYTNPTGQPIQAAGHARPSAGDADDREAKRTATDSSSFLQNAD